MASKGGTGSSYSDEQQLDVHYHCLRQGEAMLAQQREQLAAKKQRKADEQAEEDKEEEDHASPKATAFQYPLDPQ